VDERAGACPAASRLRTLLRDSDGQTLVETAFASFFMISVLLGLFSVTMALVAYQQLGYATMRATQHVAYGRSILTDPCATAASDITASLSSWNPSNFTFTLNITGTSSGSDTVYTYGPTTGAALFSCTAAGGTTGTLAYATGGANGNPVSLHVTYAYTWFPIIKNITGTLAAEDTMLAE
jgi:Flp pilus assembly protein TadG